MMGRVPSYFHPPSLLFLSLLLLSHCSVDTFQQLSLPPSSSSKVVLLNSDDLCAPAVSVFLLEDSHYSSGADVPVILDQTWCDKLNLVERSCESFISYLKTLKTVSVFTLGFHSDLFAPITFRFLFSVVRVSMNARLNFGVDETSKL